MSLSGLFSFNLFLTQQAKTKPGKVLNHPSVSMQELLYEYANAKCGEKKLA